MDAQIILLIAVAVVYAPLIAAAINGKQGGGAWKALTFLLCTLAAVLAFMLWTVAAVVAWILAWACAVAARTGVRRQATADAMLKALQEQTELLRQQAKLNSANGTIIPRTE